MTANKFTTTVTLRGAPVSRQFALLMRHKEGFEIAGHGESNADGSVTVDVTRYKPGCQYFAMALDNYGETFEPGAQVQVGDVIAPSVPAGLAFHVTSGGQLPETEPEWPEGNAPFQLGTAIVEPSKVLAPSVYGPIPLDITLDEHWGSVRMLLILEGEAGTSPQAITDHSIIGASPVSIGSQLKFERIGNPFDPSKTALRGYGGSQLNSVFQYDGRDDLSFITDATVEIWFTPLSQYWDEGNTSNHEGLVSRRHHGSYNAEWRITRYANFVQFVAYNTSGEAVNIKAYVSELPAGATHHIAVCRTGDLFEIWANGVKQDEQTFSGTYKKGTRPNDYNNLRFGSDYGSRYFNGTIHSFRFTYGVARYSGDNIKVPDQNFYAGV